MDPIESTQLFPHIRVVLGTIIGLGVARLLMTVAGLIQHPQRVKPSVLHLLWTASMLTELVLFWWWEFDLFRLEYWSFGIVLFIVFYAITLFMLCALLSPDNISDYSGYEDFFLKRRHWFFGIFALTFVLDALDTAIKGPEHLERYLVFYYIQIPFGLLLCAIAWRSANRRVHLAIVGIHILYQAYLIARFSY